MENKARVGGILSIIAGAWGIIGSVYIFFLAFYLVNVFSRSFLEIAPSDAQTFIQTPLIFMKIIYCAMGTVNIILGVLGILGGVFALKRRRWGLALTGAIASVLTFMPCGIVALIFISPARDEFSPPREVSP